MRAVIYDRYGAPDVQRLAEVERPVPKEDEVLVKIHATTVTQTNYGIRAASQFIASSPNFAGRGSESSAPSWL